MASLFLLAAMMLPRATIDVAMSIFMGKPLPVGKEAAIGFVPKKGWNPPAGDMAGSPLVIAIRIMPSSAARLQK